MSWRSRGFRSVADQVSASAAAAAHHQSFLGRRRTLRESDSPVAAVPFCGLHLRGTACDQRLSAFLPALLVSKASVSSRAESSSISPEEDVPIDMPASPKPAFYVPPAEREITDPSLSFLRKGDPLQQRHEAAMAQKRRDEGVQLGAGQEFAPQAQERQREPRVFADANAARVQSTSVHAGMPLLRGEGEADHASTVGSGEYYAAASALPHQGGGGGSEARGRLHILKGSAGRERLDAAHAMLASREAVTKSEHQLRDTIFGPKYEYSHLEDVVGEDVGLPPPSSSGAGSSPPNRLDDSAVSSNGNPETPKTPLAKQIERDIKKLEYYQGSPQYPELLRQFREKYGKAKGKDGAADDAGAEEEEERQKYTSEEVSQGLENQPIDFNRTSPLLQAQLSSGPHGYNPVTIMQQHGVMRFQGYAFPPSTELGKLKGVDDIKVMQDAYRERGLVAAVRKSFNAVVGRRDPKEEYLATEDRVRPDNHLLFRTLKLDAVQRRQMRFMLTDFDYKDRNTAFHVMMSYPYTDWIHVFFMVLVGWCLYKLQLRYGAYEFYDEYLGLDLRQVPNVKKPFIAGITVLVMVFFLFQPLLVGSIATNRAYRILMRRPIGPP